jgi:hypothetical protein
MQFQVVRQDIEKILALPGYDDGSIGPVLVRLAWYYLFKLFYNIDSGMLPELMTKSQRLEGQMDQQWLIYA